MNNYEYNDEKSFSSGEVKGSQSINDLQNEVIEEFSAFTDWMDK